MAAPVTFSVGHTDTMTIAYLDQNGNPMLETPVPDSPPVWSQDTPATATLTASGDGTSATETGIAAGTDTVSLSVVIGGATFAASLSVTVSAEAQTLSSVDILSSIA